MLRFAGGFWGAAGRLSGFAVFALRGVLGRFSGVRCNWRGVRRAVLRVIWGRVRAGFAALILRVGGCTIFGCDQFVRRICFRCGLGLSVL